MGVDGQYDHCRYTLGKQIWYLLYRRLYGPRGQCGWVRKTSLPPGFDSRTVHPVASRCIDYAIPAHSEKQVLGAKPTTPL